MDKKTWVIIAIIIAGFASLIGFSLANRPPAVDPLAQIFPASAASGNFPENIEGDPSAPVIIYDYSDYQCSACAGINPKLSQLVEEYDGKVAVVFRAYAQNYHANATAAATAAQAAAVQGYWKAYKDYLFEKQDDWFYSDAATRQQQFESYFTTVTGGKGDLTKFRTDMQSDAVATKVAFDYNLGTQRKLSFTPTLYVNTVGIKESEMNGNVIDTLRAKINAELEK